MQKKLKKKITSRTAVILPVHFAGLPCKMNEISEICNKHRLNIIEDAAHAAGSEYQKKKIGSHGDIVCFSFHPVKNLAMPTGGIISLNHKNYRKMRKILEAARWCGITDRKGAMYDVKSLGNNYYMNEFSAAIGLAQLKKLNKMNEIRKLNWSLKSRKTGGYGQKSKAKKEKIYFMEEYISEFLVF